MSIRHSDLLLDRAFFNMPRLIAKGAILSIVLVLAHRVYARSNAISESWGDSAWCSILEDSNNQYRFKVTTSEGIQDSVNHWKRDYEGSRIYWRLGSLGIDWYGTHPANRPTHPLREQFREYCNTRLYPYSDPLSEAIRAAHSQVMGIFGYVSFFDEGAPASVNYAEIEPFPWESVFQKEHPEYVVTSRDQSKKQWGVLEYAYPEVRAYFLQYFEYFIKAYPIDGLFISTRTHSWPADSGDEFGFNDVIVQEYQRRYDINILSDPRFDCNSPSFDPNSFVVENWRKLRGEYLTEFLQELKFVASRYNVKLSVGLPRAEHLGPPIGNIFLDWKNWVSNGLIDEIVVGNITGMWMYPSYRNVTRHYVQIDDMGFYTDPYDADGHTYNITPVEVFREFIDSHNPQVSLIYSAVDRMGGYTPSTLPDEASFCDDLMVDSSQLDKAYSNSPTSRPWAGTLVFVNFDSYSEGNLQGQAFQLGVWQAPSNYQIQSDIVQGGSGHALAAYCGTGASAYADFGKTISKDAVEWSFWVRRSTANSQLQLHLGPNVSTIRLGLSVSNTGAINVFNGSGWVKQSDDNCVTTGKWFRLRMYANLAQHTADVYYLEDGQDGEMLLARNILLSGSLGDIRMLALTSPVGSGNPVYVDKMELFEVAPSLSGYQSPIGISTPFPSWIYPQGGLRMQQSFDDTSSFTSVRDGPMGADTTVAADWSPLFAYGVPGIDNSVAYSGTQSLKIGPFVGNVVARVNIPVEDDVDYTCYFWIFRDFADSGALISIGNITNNEVQLLLNQSGLLALFDTFEGTYQTTGLYVPVAKWTRLRISVSRESSTCRLSMLPQDQFEQVADVSTVFVKQHGVNTIRLDSYPDTTGNVSHIDDVKIISALTCSDLWTSGLGLLWDINQDCYINMQDFAEIAANWLESSVLYQGQNIIGQDFDSFSANVSGFVGSSSDTGGRWGNFLLDGSPNISTTFAHSGNNSLVVERGKAAPFGRVAAGTDGQRFEISYWQFRYDYPSSTVITPGVSLDESSFTSCLSLGIFIQGAGNVFYFNGTAWVDTGYDMAKQKWTRIRQDVDLSKGTYGAYDLYLMEAGGTEIKILSDKALSETISTVNAMQLNPQGTTGTKTYFDDIILKRYLTCSDIWQIGQGSLSDFNHDCSVDFIDVEEFANHWLLCNNPMDETCN